MRNYVKELKSRGYSTKKLKKETGLSIKDLNSLASEKTHLKSNTRRYEIIRNANRRLAYRSARESGYTARQASESRRIFYHPTQKITRIREKKKSYTVTKYEGKKFKQLRILGEWQNDKTKELRILWAYGLWTSPELFDLQLAELQVKKSALMQLEGSNWTKVRVLDTIIFDIDIEGEGN